MTLKFDADGVQTSTFNEIYQNLDAGYRTIYGNDIITDQESPDGQRIGIETTLRFDVESAFAWLYSQIDPDLNNGDMQQVIGKLSGLSLLPSSRSQWDITVTADRNLTLPNGYTITDNNNQEWFIDSDLPINSGDTTVTFLSKLWGDVVGIAAGSTFTQSTPELGVTSISTIVDATVGRNEETEEEFRLRRQSSTENPSQSTIGAIYAKLSQGNGVSDVAVYDNSSSTPDQITGSSNKDLIDSSESVTISPHTLWVVIDGGSLDDIGEVIAKHRLGNTKGSVKVSYTDTLTRPDGSELLVINEHFIDRSTQVDLHVRLTATQTKVGSVIDTDAIKNKLLQKRFYIGEYVQAGELYPSVYIDNFNYIPSDLEISLDGVAWTDERLFSGFDGKFNLDVSNITITVVTI